MSTVPCFRNWFKSTVSSKGNIVRQNGEKGGIDITYNFSTIWNFEIDFCTLTLKVSYLNNDALFYHFSVNDKTPFKKRKDQLSHIYETFL